jgi:hypothetical protein
MAVHLTHNPGVYWLGRKNADVHISWLVGDCQLNDDRSQGCGSSICTQPTFQSTLVPPPTGIIPYPSIQHKNLDSTRNCRLQSINDLEIAKYEEHPRLTQKQGIQLTATNSGIDRQRATPTTWEPERQRPLTHQDQDMHLM